MNLIRLLIFVFGLSVGSFLGALSFRLPRGKSVLRGRSYCPKCRKKIAWYDNIPLLSFIFLSGRCRSCGKRISLRYPLVEFFTGLTFLLIFIYFPQNVFYLLLLLFVACLFIAIFVIDFEHNVIPDEIVFLIFSTSFFSLLLSSVSDFYTYSLSAFGGANFLLLLHLITKGRGMGLGDVKLALAGGIFFDSAKVLFWFFLSFVLGAVVGLSLVVLGKAKFGKQIPFGPFMIVAFFLTLFWGNRLIGIFIPWL